MTFRQAQESWIIVIKRPTLPLEKQSLIRAQFKVINKWWQRICKSFAKDKIPPEQHRETAVKIGKSHKELALGPSKRCTGCPTFTNTFWEDQCSC